MTVSVLHVHSGNMFGGIESVLLTIARHGDEIAGIRHSLALCYEGRLSNELHQFGCEARRLPAPRLSRPWTVRAARRQLRKTLTEDSFDLVVCHSAWSHGIFAPVVAASGTPVVFWLHGTASGRSLVERLAKRHQPNLVIANSEFTSTTAAAIFPHTPVVVLFNPVSDKSVRLVTNRRAALRAELSATDESVVMLLVSRLEPWKGQATLLEALAGLKADTPWRCWMTAVPQTGPEVRFLARLKGQVRRLGLEDRVTFVGPEYSVSDLYASADIFCQPNPSPEPFGLVFIEALQARLPVVATSHGGALEIVTEECGLLVPPKDPVALARALEDLIGDPSKRASLGSAGPARAAEITEPRSQLEKLRDLLVPLARPTTR